MGVLTTLCRSEMASLIDARSIFQKVGRTIRSAVRKLRSPGRPSVFIARAPWRRRCLRSLCSVAFVSLMSVSMVTMPKNLLFSVILIDWADVLPLMSITISRFISRILSRRCLHGKGTASGPNTTSRNMI